DGANAIRAFELNALVHICLGISCELWIERGAIRHVRPLAALRAQPPSRCRSDHNLAPAINLRSPASDARPRRREEPARRDFGIALHRTMNAVDARLRPYPGQPYCVGCAGEM